MELREYYKILKQNMSVVVYATIIAVVVVYAWSMKKSQTFSASLLLNITRSQVQQSSDYRYDQFYRLQADEKFSETVVEWLKSPGVAQNIFSSAGVDSDQKTMRQLEKSFSTEKVSSNTVNVRFSSLSEEEAKNIASAIEPIISEKTKEINLPAKDPDWFQVKSSDIIILKNTQNLGINLAIAAIVGIFAGIFAAFGKHYISE